MQISDVKGCASLSNGVSMPYFGLGVFQAKDGKEVINAIDTAIENGYRLIDTAALYGNEKGVGEAVRKSPVPRNEIFVTSKVWNSDQGYDKTLKAFDKSMSRLKFDYLDLYLIHWPVKSKYKETWKALERLYAEKRIRAIGVSNFLVHHLEDLKSTAEVMPMVNQFEFHPHLVQPKLLDYCKKEKILPEAWSPLKQGLILDDDMLQDLGKKYKKTSAQIVLRWNLQKGVATIPKSVNQSRIVENASIFDFSLSPDDMRKIDRLDKHQRVGADPDNFHF